MQFALKCQNRITAFVLPCDCVERERTVCTDRAEAQKAKRFYLGFCKRKARERDAEAQMRGLQNQIVVSEAPVYPPRPEHAHIGCPGPGFPSGQVRVVDQWMREDAFGCGTCLDFGCKRRGGDGNKSLRLKKPCGHALPSPKPISYGQIGFAFLKVFSPVFGFHFDLQTLLRQRIGFKIGKDRQDHVARDRRRDGQPNRTLCCLPPPCVVGVLQYLESGLDPGNEPLPVRVENHSAPMAVEDRKPKPLLNRGDTATDGTMRQTETFSGGGHGSKLGDSSDGLQPGKLRQTCLKNARSLFRAVIHLHRISLNNEMGKHVRTVYQGIMKNIVPPPDRRKTVVASLAVATTILAWGSSFPLIGLALNDIQALRLASARFAVVGILVLAWLLWKRPPLPKGKDLLLFLACGGIGIAIYNAFLNSGQVTVSAGAASFIVNIVPVITALLAVLTLGERLSALGWIGTAVSFAGVSLIAIGQPEGLQFGAGATLVLLAALCQGIFFTIQKPLVPKYGAVNCTAITLSIGAVFLLPWIGSAAGQIAAAPDPSGLSLIVFLLAVLPGVIGYITWTYALGHFGAARASNFLYLVPPTAMVIAFLIYGEVPVPTTLLGGVVAIAGVVLVNIAARRAAVIAKASA